MSVKIWNPAGGTDGSNTEGAVSVANSGGVHGTAVTDVIINNTGVPGGNVSFIAYEIDAGPNGTDTGLRFFMATSSTHLRFAADTTYNSMKLGARFGFRYNGTGPDTTAIPLVNPRDTADATVGDIRVDVSDRLIFSNKTATHITTPTPVTLTPGTAYEVEAYWRVASTTTGSCGYKVYLYGTQELVGSYYSASNINFGSVQPNSIRVSGPSGTVTNITSIDYIGPIVYGTMANTEAEYGPSALFGPPTGLTVTPISSTQMDLSWAPVLHATAYDIEADGIIVKYNNPTTTFSHTGLTAVENVDYRVRPVK